MTRAGWIATTTALAAVDAWLCLFRMGDMLGNLEAQMVIWLPGLAASHLLQHRAAERRHRELLAAHRKPHDPTSPEA